MLKWNKLLQSAFYVVITALLSVWFTRYGIENWYSLLGKPVLTPPGVVFRWVWTFLYLTMIVSFYMILDSRQQPGLTMSKRLFYAQLMLQLLWTFCFFRLGWFAAAFAIILFLLLVVYKMLDEFKKIRPDSAWILYPYFVWLCYATYLNFGIMYKNGLILDI